MDMSEDCWADHVGLLQEVPGASDQQHAQQPPPGTDFLMLQHSHHHEVGALSLDRVVVLAPCRGLLILLHVIDF